MLFPKKQYTIINALIAKTNQGVFCCKYIPVPLLGNPVW